MRRSSLLTVVGILAIAATSFAAQAKKGEAWATGQVDRFDAASRTVVVRQGTHELTFVLAADAHLMQGKTPFQPSDLAADVGRQVKVQYTTNGKTKIANLIEVSDVVAARAATKSAKPVAKAPVKH